MPCAQAVVVLYVEDDDFIGEIVEIALQEFGLEVVGVADGAAALDTITGNMVPFCVLITDVNLGTELDGWEIARRARELNRALPVVYVSGANGHEWKARGVPNSIMIVKPFTPIQLVGAVTSLLKEADPTRPES
jgi:DNA-binding response OmpR family regulator